MPSEKKKNIVKDLIGKLQEAKTVALTDYQGLTTKQTEELRNKIQGVRGDFQIIKNTLLKQALNDSQLKIAGADEIAGPTALIFSQDENSALKVLRDFSKDSGKPQLKLGFLDKAFLDKAQIQTLATLPSREALLTKLLIDLTASITRFIWNLKTNQTKLLYALSSIDTPAKRGSL